jgi:hypothetical protein
MNTTENGILNALIRADQQISSTWVLAVPNCYTQRDNEADLFLIRKSGLCDEIEVKVSRSDLLADRSKEVRVQVGRRLQKRPKQFALALGELTCNYFWYAIKEGIGSVEDIPLYAGLIVVRPCGRITVVRRPDRLHSRKLSFEERYHFACKLHYRYWGVQTSK